MSSPDLTLSRVREQEEPHPHIIEPSPDKRFVFVCDLGRNSVISYALDAENSKLTPNGECVLHVGAGTATPPNPQPSSVSRSLAVDLNPVLR